MAIVTVSVTPTHKYFERKNKDDLIRWIEQQRHVHLTIAEFNAERKKFKWQLAREAMEIVRSWPCS